MTIVAYIDSLGYLRCAECVSRLEHEASSMAPMYSDNSALDMETCDACGSVAIHATSNTYRFIKPDQHP